MLEVLVSVENRDEQNLVFTEQNFFFQVCIGKPVFKLPVGVVSGSDRIRLSLGTFHGCVGSSADRVGVPVFRARWPLHPPPPPLHLPHRSLQRLQQVRKTETFQTNDECLR